MYVYIYRTRNPACDGALSNAIYAYSVSQRIDIYIHICIYIYIYVLTHYNIIYTNIT